MESRPQGETHNWGSGCVVLIIGFLVGLAIALAVLLVWPYLPGHQHPAVRPAPVSHGSSDTLLPPPEQSDLGPASER